MVRTFTLVMMSTALSFTAVSPVLAQDAEASGTANVAAQAQARFDLQEVVNFAGERAAEVVAQFQALGYQVVDMSVTLLGRIRITMQNETQTREIVVSRTTGEIKSDVVISSSRPEGGSEASQAAEGSLSIDAETTIGGSGDGGTSAGGSVGLGVGVKLGK